VLRQEEERFAETLIQGMTLSMPPSPNSKGSRTIAGETVFKLYDTFGSGRSHGGYRPGARVESIRRASRRPWKRNGNRARCGRKFNVDLRGGRRSKGTTEFWRLRLARVAGAGHRAEQRRWR